MKNKERNQKHFSERVQNEKRANSRVEASGYSH